MTLGMACGTVGVLLLTRIDGSSGYGALLPGFLLFGVALGLVYAPMSTAAMAAMPHAKAGIAAGVLAMTRMVSGAVVLAGMAAVFGELRADRAPSDPPDTAYALALGDALWLIVVLCASGTLLTWLLVRAPSDAERPPGERRWALPHHRHHL